ncbi:unnamed protein product [Rotaria socialis]|uniref:Uncharacterized protein n=1 Tax=Rotaria socialis TaxID=392032 RepID=A0A818NF39_9BILA|nr:unnamed protein product [Rotaria socialis]CAF3605902.1 unnamed protein product [Rotaria socialis]CAF3735488.1 unnamed protein product [Rotaria socialis]
MTFVNFNHRYNRTTFYIPINTTHIRLFSIPNRLNSNQTNVLLNFFSSSSSSLTTDPSSIASLTQPNGHRIYSKNFLPNTGFIILIAFLVLILLNLCVHCYRIWNSKIKELLN